jgi:hypothetical protein
VNIKRKVAGLIPAIKDWLKDTNYILWLELNIPI